MQAVDPSNLAARWADSEYMYTTDRQRQTHCMEDYMYNITITCSCMPVHPELITAMHDATNKRRQRWSKG